MSVKNRIKEFVDYLNITISAFEKEIESSNGYVNSISKSIGLDKLVLILEKYPNLSLEWLLTGKGEMLRNNDLNLKNIDFKELAEARRELLEYKDKEIQNLKNKIEEMTVDLEIYSDHFKDEARKSLTNKSKKT